MIIKLTFKARNDEIEKMMQMLNELVYLMLMLLFIMVTPCIELNIIWCE